MSRLLTAFLALTLLACGGAGGPIARANPVAVVTQGHDVQRTEVGLWPSTPGGVCAHLMECGCNPAGSHPGCVAQFKLAEASVKGIISLQDQILDIGLEGDDSPEAKLARDAVTLTTALFVQGMETDVAVMANMECQALCSRLEQARME